MENSLSTKKKDFIWNTVSSMLNAGMSALLLLMVSRILGEDDAGIFALAYSIAQLLATIGYFELRSLQVTDVAGKYSYSDYFTFKVLACAVMMAVSVGYVLAGGYSRQKAVLILLLCLLKMLDTFEDYFVTVYQKEGLLHIGAKYSSLRFMSVMAFFFLLVVATRNVYISVGGTVCLSAAMIYFLMIRSTKKRFGIRLSSGSNAILGIAFACLPLFISAYLILYVGNAPKYAIDTYMELRFQTYYGILYLPSFVINLFSGFVFKPMLVDLSAYYYEDRGRYKGMLGKILLVLFVIFIGVAGAGYLLGIPVLSILYSVDLSAYRFDLVLMITGGAFAAFCIIMEYVITIMRKQKWLLISGVVTALLAYFLSPHFVKNYGIRGAALAFLLFNGVRALVSLGIMLVCDRRRQAEVSSDIEMGEMR